MKVAFVMVCSILLALATRLVFWGTNVFYVDGDEAVLGIMAKDLIKHGEVSPYFQGQNYGFSLLEILVVSLGQLGLPQIV